MLPVLNGVHGGDWIACEMVSPGTGSRYPGMGGSCIASITGNHGTAAAIVYCVSPFYSMYNLLIKTMDEAIDITINLVAVVDLALQLPIVNI